MVPILFTFGFLKIYTFGIFLVLALFWALFILWRIIKLTSYKEEDVFDIFFVSLTFALFFGRLLFFIANAETLKFDLLKFILINGYPGMSLIGCLLGGFLAFYVACRRKKIAPLDLVDYFTPSLFIALAIGKIGSFLSGVDSGTKTKFFLAVHYSGLDGTRHIVAIYESILFFIGAYICYRCLLQIRRQAFASGTALYLFVLIFSGTSMLLDKLKYNHLYLAGFSINFATSVILFGLAGCYFIYYFRSDIITKYKQYEQTFFKRNSRGTSQKTDK